MRLGQHLFAVIHTDGEMSNYELRAECPKKNWLPLLVIRPGVHEKPVLLLFHSKGSCMRFYRRNFPRSPAGCVRLDPSMIEQWANERGKIEILDFPKKIRDMSVVGFEVVYFPDEGVHPTYIERT